MAATEKNKAIRPKYVPIDFMSFSNKIVMRRDGLLKNGSYPLYFQCFIDGKRVKIALNISAKPQEFNPKSGKFKGNTERANDHNMIIDDAIARANRIVVNYRLANKTLTTEMFKEEFTDPDSRIDFLKFYEKELNFRQGVIDDATLRQNKTTLVKLRRFRGTIHFSDINYEFLQEFDKFLKITFKNGPNTRSHAFKNIRTYIKIARRKGIKLEDPFRDFKIRQLPGKREFLTLGEVQRLIHLYYSSSTSIRNKNVLQRFLFSCFVGGLRISDSSRIEGHMIVDNELIFIPHKTRNLQKEVRIPLPANALQFIGKNQNKMFHVISDGKTNKYLKDIAKLAGIDKKLTFHVARHTFATLFLEAGGDVVTLKEIMGHSDIATTMIYVHITDKHKKKEMDKFDKMFDNPPTEKQPPEKGRLRQLRTGG